MSKPKPLTLKERRFVDAYLGSAKGNGSEAAITAGYAIKSARITASKLLTKANIRGAVDARQAKAEAKGVADALERDLVVSTIMRDTTESGQVRINAAKELNKCSGRHSVNVKLDASETLADIIAASRRPAVTPAP